MSLKNSLNLQAFYLADITQSSTLKSSIIELYRTVFADYEGQAEGDSIADLVTETLDTMDKANFYGFVAKENEKLVGEILFTRLTLPVGDKSIFLLSPVAVATSQQSKGVGQQLITFGLNKLKSAGVDWVFTYGDPNYYSKVAFEQVAESFIPAPYPLQFPMGWQGMAFAGELETVDGRMSCVPSYAKAQIW